MTTLNLQHYYDDIDYKVTDDVNMPCCARDMAAKGQVVGARAPEKRDIMSVNGVTGVQDSSAYSYTSAVAEKETAESTKTSSAAAKEEAGAVYEPSKKAATDSAKKTYTPDTNLVNKLKADADARTQQLRSLVEKMMGKQANTYGKANNIWQFLKSGDYTVDAATKAQAQADISENGYWGVNQTSDRILSFATALTGGDPDKIEEMREAFKKGYAQAEKTWGGSLPEISQQTYDAVMKKFDELAAQNNVAGIEN